MGNYLDYINDMLEKQDFNDWYIDDFFYFSLHDYNEKDDPIISILEKHSAILNDYKDVNISDNEADIILDSYQIKYNVVIRSILDYYLSNSYLRKNSFLVDDCIEYSNLFFENIDKINGGLPAHILSMILKWTLYKYPSKKNLINNNIYSKINCGDINILENFSIVDYFLRDDELNAFFSEEQYCKLLARYFKSDVNPRDIFFYMDTYNDFLNYFNKKDKKEYKILLKKYCDFIFSNMNKIDNHVKQVELQKVRQYIDFLKSYSDGDYKIIDEELERVNKDQLSKLEHHSISLPEEQFEELKKQIEKNTQIYEKLSNSNKIWKLLFETHPLSINDLKKRYDESKKGLSGLFKENILDSDGRVINFNKLSDEQEFSLKSTQNIGLSVDLYFDLIYGPFCRSFKMDEEAKECIRSIISNNKLVDSSRSKLIFSLFVSFFEGDYQHSVFDIILELEESIRYYLKSTGLNIVKRDGSGDYIGLNNVFNDYEKNSYRDELLKIIDEDYYFTFKWFLTDQYGFDIRDKISHRIKTIDLYKTKFAIYIAIHIFRLYWGFQK